MNQGVNAGKDNVCFTSVSLFICFFLINVAYKVTFSEIVLKGRDTDINHLLIYPLNAHNS